MYGIAIESTARTRHHRHPFSFGFLFFMANDYNAADIEVLQGLEPVQRRPGMYTDTTRPNHLAQEVIDNAVDEALAGHAKRIEVTLFTDGSCEVIDDGRGMPVDIHPEHKVSGQRPIGQTRGFYQARRPGIPDGLRPWRKND